MKFSDLTKFGNFMDVANNLKSISSKLKVYEATIRQTDKADYLGFAFKNIAKYTSKQMELLSAMVTSPIETIAWTARNLFECYLLCQYLLLDPTNSLSFVMQKASDELQINEGFISLSDASTPESILQPLLDRNKHIRAIQQKYGAKEYDIWNVKFLAEKTGNLDEYEAFFKLYSKYVHPSSWIILAEKNEFDSMVFRNIFILRAQYYSSLILKLFENYPKRISEN